MTLQLHINKHMNYILHRIHTLRYIYPTSTYSNIGGKMGQAGSKSEGQFIPLWDCTGGTLDRGCSTGNDWKYDPKLLTILNTPPPRRKRNKNVQKTRSDSFSNEQYFITELRYRKDFICRVFDFYAKDQKRLFLSELRILINDVEDSDSKNVITTKEYPKSNSISSSSSKDNDNNNSKEDIIQLGTKNTEEEFSNDLIVFILEKLGGQRNDDDVSKSFVSKDAFVTQMFNSMNMKTFDEKTFDRILCTLCIKGKHKDETQIMEVKLILLHIWDAFDWNMDGRQSYDEFVAFAKTAFGNESTEEACKDMYMAMLPGVEEKDLDNHPGARLPDFVNWLWDSLSPMEKAERQNVLQEFINIALQQPGAKKEILSNLL